MIRKLVIQTIGCGTLLACGAMANSYDFFTPSGATTSGGAVDASATLMTGNGTLSITLNDLLANPTDVAQLVSDIKFGFNSDISSSGTSLTSASGTGISVGDNGSTSSGTVSSTAWELSGFHLTALGGGQPVGLIIGPGGSGGTYGNANGSIAGNKPHNPFYNQTATFVLSIPGVTSDTVVNSATFSFGTTAGVDIVGVPNSVVPDGGTTVLLLGAALSGLGLIRRKLG
jgi:hypothetical protein